MATSKKAIKGSNNFIGEWYGVRLFPETYCKKDSIHSFENQICPYLTDVLRSDQKCIKNEKSQGVCTITTRSKEGHRDWMVCPYRALDHEMLLEIVELIFHDSKAKKVFPVLALRDEKIIKELSATERPFYLFFQDKLGGEISLPGSDYSPEISFDITIIKAEFKGSRLKVSDFGIYEVQTMDFHGSYGHAVKALENAVDLHKNKFADVISANPEWLSRNIEGPNIANVFKRTFYQTILKFKLAGKGNCSGVVLGLPISVWNSWQPHLGKLELKKSNSSTFEIKGSEHSSSKTWILVFELVPNPKKGKSELKQSFKIRVDSDRLLKAAFSDVPESMISGSLPVMNSLIVNRIKKYFKDVE